MTTNELALWNLNNKWKKLIAWEASLKRREEQLGVLQRTTTESKKRKFNHIEQHTAFILNDKYAWNIIAASLSHKDVTMLSQVSHFIHSCLRGFMEDNLTFRIPVNVQLATLEPKRIKVSSCLYLTNPSTTHVELDTTSFDDLTGTKITHLSANHVKHYIENKLPTTLTHLTLPAFTLPVDKLPASLTHLTLGDAFNHQVNSLPSGLTHLTIGNAFNRTLRRLPMLTHLSLGNSFNNPLCSLPPSLTHLTLGDSFNLSIQNLPQKLLQLSIGNAFNQQIGKLPPMLLLLTTGDSFRQPLNTLPSRTTHMRTSLFRFKQNPKVPSFIFKYKSKGGGFLEFDCGVSHTGVYGMTYGDRVATPNGPATVIGVRENRIWFHCDRDRDAGASFWDWDDVKNAKDLLAKGIIRI